MAVTRRASMLFARLMGVLALTLGSLVAPIIGAATPAGAVGEEGCSYGSEAIVNTATASGAVVGAVAVVSAPSAVTV
ncbi:MAG: hypothetical protein JWN20_758, partial [Jatrophihabitantaceae bacterium]|nr:hypothetical protein [Jatrophihabitantaceae bacterium]